MSGPGVEPPAARQGPGPIAPPLIEALDVAVSRLVARTLPGDRRAAGVGLGTELAQLRPYEIGDDVRHIDAAATARTRQPHIRLHVPERALTTWIVLDVSPSMAFGTARRLKADVAEGVAVVFGRLGVRRAGSVGPAGVRRRSAPSAPAPRIQTGDRGAQPRAGPGCLARWPAGFRGAGGRTGGAGPAGPAAGTRGRGLRISGISTIGSDRSVRCAFATRCSRSRSSIRANPRCRSVGHLALIDPETGARLEVNTFKPSGARAVRRARARAQRGGRPRAPPAARSLTSPCQPTTNGSVELGRRAAMSFAVADLADRVGSGADRAR